MDLSARLGDQAARDTSRSRTDTVRARSIAESFAVACPKFLILVAGVYLWSTTLRSILPARSPVDRAGPPLSPGP